MDQNIDTLTILAEVTTAFVAFAAIVASLRMTLGEELSAFQRLLVHFFTEGGMLIVSVALLPLVLAGFWQDELTVARIANIYALVVFSTYTVFYLRRRVRINAPTPFASLVVMIGVASWIIVLAITGMEIYWQPSLEIIAAFCLWVLVSGVLIFARFLASFVHSQAQRV